MNRFKRYEFAAKYCQQQLAIMYGTFEIALENIGTERYKEMVMKVATVADGDSEMQPAPQSGLPEKEKLL